MVCGSAQMFLFSGAISASSLSVLKGSFSSRGPVPGVGMAAGSPVNMSPTEMWEEKRIWRGPCRLSSKVTPFSRAHG